MRRWFGLGWIALAIVSAQAAADPLAYRFGKRVVAVELEGAEATGLDRAEGLRYIDIRPGDRFSIQAVRRSVKLLYHLGLFGQVRASARSVEGGLVLTFELVAKRRVLSVELIGCEAVGEGELRRLSRLARGEEYDHWKMEAGVADMLGLYRSRGHRRVRIVADAQGGEKGDVAVRYFVQEGPPTRISRIWFKGAPGFSHAQLCEVMELDRGDVLSAQRLQEALQRLREFYFRSGHLEARVTAPEPDPEQPVLWEEVPVEVDPGPVVRFRFEGRQVFSDRKLQGELPVEGGAPLGDFALRDLVEHIERLYRRHGYARVRVSTAVHVDPRRNLKEVVFELDEGPRVAVRALRFEGNRAFDDDQLQAYVHDVMIDAIPQSGLGQQVDPGDVDPLGGGHPLRGRERKVSRPQGFLFELAPETMYLREPYEKALQEIADLYLSQGYLDVEVGTPMLSYDLSGANLYVTVPIREGPLTRVASISFGGNQAVPAEALLAVADRLKRYVKPGGPLDLYGVEVLRKELVRVYRREGYVFCRVEQEVIISADRARAQVHYQFEEGPRVRVGRVLVRGNLGTDPQVTDSMLALRPGEVYSPEKEQTSQDALLALGVFSDVDIKLLDPDVVESVKDVVVHVRERLPHQLELSPGLSSAEGLRVNLGYTHRNLFGYALESVNKAKVSYQIFYATGMLDPQLREHYREMSLFEGLEWRLMSGLHWPRMWFVSRDLAGRFDVVGLREHAPSYDLTKLSVVPGVDFKLSSELAFTVEYELEYIALDCPFNEPGEPCGGSTADRWRRYDKGELLLGAFRPELSWDLRDNPFNPHRGALFFLRAELAHPITLAQPVFFAKLDGQVSGYLPLGRRTTLALALRAGVIGHILAESKTPSHKLFFLGGRNSMRGFGEENLIPADLDPPCISAQDDPQRQNGGGRKCVSPGGNAYLLLKFELRFPLLSELLQGALFVDLGNLWEKVEHFNPAELRVSAGVGLRLTTPIGPLAFDFGFNLLPDEARGEESWSLHFNVGVF